MARILLIAFVLLPLLYPGSAQARPRSASTSKLSVSSEAAKHWPTNAEMTAMFDADQKAREVDKIDWKVLGEADHRRLSRTKALLSSGALQSGDDFWHSAFIFQHGDGANDYLLAYALATVAIARGRTDGGWIAAATLDRYLQTIGRKQIYGTQFAFPDSGKVNQEPYDRSLISDALRIASGVPSQDEQVKQGEMFRR